MKKLKQINTVLTTSDYSLFKTLKGNRMINTIHVKRLTKSFSKSYLLSPIIVNKGFEIIDGQHRFEAAKQLKYPVNFIICSDYGLEEVQLLNTNMKNWKKVDYLNGYCDLDYPEYIKFRSFMNRFPKLGIASCETLLTQLLSGGHKGSKSVEFKTTTNKSGSYAIRYFQEGALIIPNYEKSIEYAERIMVIRSYYDGFNRPTFVRAIVGVFKIDYFDFDKFILKLKNNRMSLQHCTNVTQYKLMIEEIYNYRSRDKVSLRFY